MYSIAESPLRFIISISRMIPKARPRIPDWEGLESFLYWRPLDTLEADKRWRGGWIDALFHTLKALQIVLGAVC